MVFQALLDSAGSFAVVLNYFFIILECFLPFLPQVAFISFFTYTFNPFIAYILSYTAACIGSILVFFVYKYVFKNKEFKLVEKYINFKFETITLLIAIPFSPSGIIGPVLAIGKYDTKKFIWATILGKLTSVYFWVFVGNSITHSVNDIETIIKLFIILLLGYIVSLVVKKQLDL